MNFETRRRMLMNMESQWADEPLVVFDLSSGPVFGQVTMNGAYYLKPPSNDKVNTFSGYSGNYGLADGKSLYLEDVTKYKKLTIVGKWSKATSISDPGYAFMGILKDEYFNANSSFDNNSLSSFSAGKKIAVTSTSQKTYSFDVTKLTGAKRFYLNCAFVFSGGGTSSFEIKKMMLE